MRLIKLGGNELDRPGFLDELARALAAMQEEVVVVHGGGQTVDRLQEKLGIEPTKIDGMRATDTDSLEAVVMALCGSVNKRIVAALVNHGIDAVGLSGVDGGLLRVRKLEIEGLDLGWVGEITDVRTEVLNVLLSQGITPVVAPVSLGPGGQMFNVNADQAASAIASALRPRSLDFVSNVAGVKLDEALISLLGSAEAEQLVAQGKINGGMVPKVRAALDALLAGVPAVRIVDLSGLADAGAGTTLRTDPLPSRLQGGPSEAQHEG